VLSLTSFVIGRWIIYVLHSFSVETPINFGINFFWETFTEKLLTRPYYVASDIHITVHSFHTMCYYVCYDVLNFRISEAFEK
jgi:hypothetical protein